MNKRTLFFLKYFSHTFLSKGLMLVVCERWVGDRNRLLYWPKDLLTIEVLLSQLGCSTVGLWGPKTLCLPLALNSASCPQLTPTPTDSSRLCPGYIFVWHPPASADIYTGASLDWRLVEGQYVIYIYIYIYIYIKSILH